MSVPNLLVFLNLFTETAGRVIAKREGNARKIGVNYKNIEKWPICAAFFGKKKE